ncbi:hypothetical protein Ancab_012271 [Ancistrocladus abbreviatus]
MCNSGLQWPPGQVICFSLVHFPLILFPNPTAINHGCLHTLINFTEVIKACKPWLQSHLHGSGAILLRDFPVSSASDFNQVVEAFDFEEMPYVGGTAPRSKVVGRVLEFPSKLFFFCEVEPRSGGETAIVLSDIVCERMKERLPEFVQQLEERGLIYTWILSEDDNVSSAIGSGWKSTFLTDDKRVAEERAAKIGTKLEWLDDMVKVVMGPVPAIRFDESRQRKVWFNTIVIAYTNYEDARNDGNIAGEFGDGRPLPPHIVYDCEKILEEESVAIPWQKWDVLLLDNWAVLHSRRSFNPPCRVLAFTMQVV